MAIHLHPCVTLLVQLLSFCSFSHWTVIFLSFWRNCLQFSTFLPLFLLSRSRISRSESVRNKTSTASSSEHPVCRDCQTLIEQIVLTADTLAVVADTVHSSVPVSLPWTKRRGAWRTIPQFQWIFLFYSKPPKSFWSSSTHRHLIHHVRQGFQVATRCQSEGNGSNVTANRINMSVSPSGAFYFRLERMIPVGAGASIARVLRHPSSSPANKQLHHSPPLG